MGIFKEIDICIENARKKFEEIKRYSEKTQQNLCSEEYGACEDNIFYSGDNLEFIKKLLNSGFAGKIQLVYIDPPFFSKSKYSANLGYKGFKIRNMAYNDIFDGNIVQYIEFLAVRLFCIRDLLSETGSVWVHLDWHAVHYIKIVMDEIFGEQNFVNEIIWSYKSGGSGKRSFSKKHDTILFYSKSKKYNLNIPKEKSYNRGFKPYKFSGVKEYEDENGWYTMVNMKDVWQLDMLGRSSKERTGYMTQKPETLMTRIIESTTNPGDICIDFFSGSGSFAASCEKLGRKWFASDFGAAATSIFRRRLLTQGANFKIIYDESKKKHKNLLINVEKNGKGYIIKLEGLSLSKPYDRFYNPQIFESFESAGMSISNDSDKFIDYWGIYGLADDKKYKALRVEMRSENGELKKEVEIKENIFKNYVEICVIATDLLGNIYERSVKKRMIL